MVKPLHMVPTTNISQQSSGTTYPSCFLSTQIQSLSISESLNTILPKFLPSMTYIMYRERTVGCLKYYYVVFRAILCLKDLKIIKFDIDSKKQPAFTISCCLLCKKKSYNDTECYGSHSNGERKKA